MKEKRRFHISQNNKMKVLVQMMIMMEFIFKKNDDFLRKLWSFKNDTNNDSSLMNEIK